MNLMNLMKRFCRVRAVFEKNIKFFFLGQAKTGFFASQMFICFINCEDFGFVYVIDCQNQFRMAHLMNLMNLYEVKIFKRIFENAWVTAGEFMKQKTWVTS